MLTWFLIMPATLLFMVVNVIVGCYVMIRLGYGPPNWQTALNQAVRVTMLQDQLNKMRNWIDKKAPWADQVLNRLHVPKPIIIVDTTPEEEYPQNEVPDKTVEEYVSDEETVAPLLPETELSASSVPEP